jgi:small subunit ribosomal protein S2
MSETSTMTVKDMLESGAHFGHHTHVWNPRMKPYIFGARHGIHIINLQKTLDLAQAAFDCIESVVSQGYSILFVGTKKQAQHIVADESIRAEMFYVNHRWLGGMLTNFKTIKASIDRLNDLEEILEKGDESGYKKKERLLMSKDVIKLKRSLGGIREMTKLPGALFIIDPRKEHIAIKEARKLGIPVMAVADTNCNPEGIDFLIPANDDAIKSIRLFMHQAADACLRGKVKRQAVIRDEVTAEDAPRVARETNVKGATVSAYVGDKNKQDQFEGEAKGAFTQADAEKEKEGK